ncbi:unnamed protein product [Camellia sinensis]
MNQSFTNLFLLLFCMIQKAITSSTNFGIFINKMIDIQDFLLGFYIISFFLYFLQGLKKTTLCIATSLTSPPPPPPSSSWFFFEHAKNSKNRGLGSTDNQEDDSVTNNIPQLQEENMFCEVEGKVGDVKAVTTTSSSTIRLKKRPGKLIVPEHYPSLEFGDVDKKIDRSEEFEVVEGRDYYLASKKGKREVMEDRYGVLLNILGDRKQAFFAVIDGHGGQAAADYVAENLGKNIVKALEFVGDEEDQLEAAIHRGYLDTDKEFLSQGVNGGACAASVLFRDGNLHVANVGDCKVVLSRNGVAHVLTTDHRLSREDERFRIESSGGYVHCINGVWRVNGSLAVSRAIGDLHLKQWVISEPHINNFPLSSDCDFLIMASDGLWDKVNDQEAVDVVLKNKKNSQESCRKLVDMSLGRGNRDDITIMVIDVQQFVASATG